MIISRQWSWFRSLKWGRNAPGAVLWWIVSPIGQCVIVDEFKFQGLSPKSVAKVIGERDAALNMRDIHHGPNVARYLAADAELWGDEDGPNIPELFARAGLGLLSVPGDRVQGYMQVAALMQSTVSDPTVTPTVTLPALVVSARCTMLKRSLPLLREGNTKKEDIHPTPDQCLVEALRVGVMSRPSPTVADDPMPPEGTCGHSLRMAIEANERGDEESSGYVPG